MRVINYHPSQLQWVPVSDLDRDDGTSEILRIGQLVCSEGIAGANFGGGGVFGVEESAGLANTTTEERCVGVVVATNNKIRVLSTLADFVGIEQITGVASQAEMVARASSQSGGHWPQSDLPMVQIVRLTPYTKVRVNLYNLTRGVAPTVNTVTSGSAAGTAYTSDAADVAAINGLGSSYCRSGLNKGRMRQSSDTSDVTKAFPQAFRDDIVIGDTFVSVPIRPFGISYVYLDVEGDFFDISKTPATNYHHFDVHELHLETAGEEYVIGTFAPEHFLGIRA